jgi:hypothetical protein
MNIYERLGEENRSSRRAVADVLQMLSSAVPFGSDQRAIIDVGMMKLPSGEAVGLVQFFFCTATKTYIVSLPTSKAFQAIRHGACRPEPFDVLLLNGASVDCNGNVHLKDGLRVRAVNVIPALLPLKPSELDWQIVHATVRAVGAEKRCYRRLTDRAPGRLRRLRQQSRPAVLRTALRNQRFLDCRALRGLSTLPLKELIYRLGEVDPELKNISGQKISHALRMFGMRVPAQRPRRARAAR